MTTCRSSSNRRIAGVCGDLAEQAGWSATRLRVVWVLATIFTAFAGVFVYLALRLLMPKEPAHFESAPLQPWRR